MRTTRDPSVLITRGPRANAEGNSGQTPPPTVHGVPMAAERRKNVRANRPKNARRWINRAVPKAARETHILRCNVRKSRVCR